MKSDTGWQGKSGLILIRRATYTSGLFPVVRTCLVQFWST
jgi:hypothetical protein